MKHQFPYETTIEDRRSKNDFDQMILWCMDRFGMPAIKHERYGTIDGNWVWDRWPKNKDMKSIVCMFGFKNEDDYSLFVLTWD